MLTGVDLYSCLLLISISLYNVLSVIFKNKSNNVYYFINVPGRLVLKRPGHIETYSKIGSKYQRQLAVNIPVVLIC